MEKEICILKNFRNILDATTETDCSELDKAIATIEEAMNRTCEGCEYVIKYPNGCHECCLLTYADQEGCTSCIEVDKDFYCNKYKLKDNA